MDLVEKGVYVYMMIGLVLRRPVTFPDEYVVRHLR